MLIIPGEQSREVWRFDETTTGWVLHEGQPVPSESIFAIEVPALKNNLFWVPATGDDHATIQEAAAPDSQLGVGETDEGRVWVHWTVGREGKRMLMASAGPTDRRAKRDWARAKSQSFELSPRLFRIPDNEAAIWMELGRYVIAFKRDSKLAYFTTLSSRAINSHAVTEISEIVTRLESEQFLKRPERIRMWTNSGRGFPEALKEQLNIRLCWETKPAPRLPSDVCPLLPAEFIRRRKHRAAVKILTTLLVILATVIVCLQCR